MKQSAKTDSAAGKKETPPRSYRDLQVRSTRGAKGGYRFSRKPSELTLLDIIEVMEGPLAIVDGVQHSGTGNDQGATLEIWERLNTEIRESMRRITLQDMIDNCHRMNAEAGCFDYCI